MPLDPSSTVDVTSPDTDVFWGETRDVLYKEYRKLLIFIAVWVVAVIIAVFTINAPVGIPLWKLPTYTSTNGYTWSLALLYLPLGFLISWYRKNRDEKQLRPLMRALLLNVLATAGLWLALDVFLANVLFTFPDPRAHWLPMVWGYAWTGACSTLATILNPSCYQRNIPLEEYPVYCAARRCWR